MLEPYPPNDDEPVHWLKYAEDLQAYWGPKILESKVLTDSEKQAYIIVMMLNRQLQCIGGSKCE